MNQLTFADHPTAAREAVNWKKHALALSFDERDILGWIMDLHNGGRPFDLDLCYSFGRFWDGFEKPRLKFDLRPQVLASIGGVVCANAAAIPLPNESVESVMFDPPFVVGQGRDGKTGVIRERFSSFRSIAELWTFYADALRETHRILKEGGRMALKCQDVVDSGTQRWSHLFLMNTAIETGFYVKDLFVLGRDRVMMSPSMERQLHARKNHCFFLVLVKEQTK